MSTETSNFQIEIINNKDEIVISSPILKIHTSSGLEEGVALEPWESKSTYDIGKVVLTNFGEIDESDIVPGQSNLIAHRPWLGPILSRMKQSDWAS